jgi:hypothetical protein
MRCVECGLFAPSSRLERCLGPPIIFLAEALARSALCSAGRSAGRAVGSERMRASTVPPRSAMSGGRTGTRSARAKPCSDCASSCPIFREQAIEPIAGTDERSATKVFRAGLSTAHAGFISLNAPYDEGLTFTPLPGNMVEASGNWERHYCRLPVRVWHMLST